MNLNKEYLKVNGEKCSDELHKKYLKLAEEMAGENIDKEGYNLSIQKEANGGSKRAN